jgi:hypothetical protein
LCGFAATLSLKITHRIDTSVRKEGAEIMASNYAFTGVGVAGMSRTLRVAAPAAHAAAPAAHPAHAAAAIPQPKRRTAATAPSVDRGTT